MVGVSVWLSGRCNNYTVKIEKKTYRSKKNVIILDGFFTNNRLPIFLIQARGISAHFHPLQPPKHNWLIK